MSTINKQSARILATGSSNSDDVDQGKTKIHENGGNMGSVGDDKAGNTVNVGKIKSCLVCDGKDDWVLVCYGQQCPIAIHHSCTSDEPDFDEFGNFYCPYCWYKRVTVKCVELGKQLMMAEKTRKGFRETLGVVDLGLMMDKVTEDVENVLGGRTSSSSVSSTSRKRRKGDESDNKYKVLEKNQKMKEVSETHSRENAKADDGNADADEGRQHQGRFSEKNHETSNVARGSEKNHETIPEHNYDMGVKTRSQKKYSENNQQNKTIAGTHVRIDDEGTQAPDSDLDYGRSGQGCCHENSQQKNVSATVRCEQKVPRTNKRVSHGSGLGEGRDRKGKHIEKNQHTETIESETEGKGVRKDRKRKHERGVERDGDEFYMGESQVRQFQSDKRNDNVAFNKQETGFRKDEQVEQKLVSSPDSTNNVNESNVASQELASVINRDAGVQEQPIKAQPICTVYSKKPSYLPEKYGHKSYPEKIGTLSNDPGQRKITICSSTKRKRQFWTQEELEMLRVGVQKFPGVRNIPWRKILEYGRDVFHDDRVPSDLKDKWKMMNKMASDTGKRPSLSTERQPNYYVTEVSSE